MTDNEKIQSFGDMVDAVEKLTKPIQQENERLHKQLIIERIVSGIIIALFIWFAYMAPVEMDQSQEFDQHTQNQSYSEGVTSGE